MHTLADVSPVEVFSKMMSWPKSDELDAMLDKLDKTTLLDMDAEINALMAETARQAFLVGYRCGRNPDLLLFAQDA
jgi:hypothetical protein